MPDQIELAQLRTVLAGERTFAAWIRTGLACIAGGLVLVKLMPFGSGDRTWIAELVSQILITGGLLLFIFAFVNYRRLCAALGTKEVAAAPLWVFGALTAVLVLIGALVLWLTI